MTVASNSFTVRPWLHGANPGGVVVLNSAGHQLLNTTTAAASQKLADEILAASAVTPPSPPPSGITLPAAPACPAPSAGWTVAFGDTFSTGKLDTNFWVPNRCPMSEVDQDKPGDNGNNNELFNASQVTVGENGLELTCEYRPSGSYSYLSGYAKTEPSARTPDSAPQGFALQMDTATMWAFEIVCTLPPTTVAGYGADWNFWMTDNPYWTIEFDFFEIWDWNPSFYSFTPSTWIYDTRSDGMNQEAYYSTSGPPIPAFVTDGKEHRLTWLFDPDNRHVQPYQDDVALGNGISYPASFNEQAWMHLITEAATRVDSVVKTTRTVNVRSIAAYYRTGDPAKITGGGLAAGAVVA